MSERFSADVLERVRRTLAGVQSIPIEQITVEATFEELGIDSIDVINILFAMEHEFGIQIPDEPARLLKNIRELAEGVQQLLDAQRPNTD